MDTRKLAVFIADLESQQVIINSIFDMLLQPAQNMMPENNDLRAFRHFFLHAYGVLLDFNQLNSK